MLCRPSGGCEDIKKLLGAYGNNVICETKYDGERTQIHYDKGKITLFSRNAEQQNVNYPELTAQILEYLKVYILLHLY